MNWSQYEYCCANWWNKKYHNDKATVTLKGSHGEDGGIDLKIETPYGLKYGQCKHNFKEWLKVGVVRELKGVMAVDGVESGVIFSHTKASRHALDFAKRSNIEIIQLRA